MFNFLKFVSLVLYFNYHVHISASSKDAATEERPKRPKFSVNLALVEDSSHEKQTGSFHKEVDCLSASIIKSYPGLTLSTRGLEGLVELITKIPDHLRSHLFFIFDVHGTLTNAPTPGADEGPHEILVGLYRQLSELGTTVLISSAWSEISGVLKSLDKAGITHLDESVVKEDTIKVGQGSHFNILNLGNIVNVQYEGVLALDRLNTKSVAALWYARKLGIDSITVLALFDDNPENVSAFPNTAGEALGISYKASHAIQVPDSLSVNSKGFTLASSFSLADGS